jgi:signal transduction histidine kinase
VQRLTDLLGAEVRLTSVVGRGTWVQVYLPLFQTDSDPVQKA